MTKDAANKAVVSQNRGSMINIAGLDVPLYVHGMAFQQLVWHALDEIPAGTTISYSEIAKRLGMAKAARAVASACAANQIAVAIPCHRVICKDGSLAGYRWGIERKRTLLSKETKR